MLKLLFLLPALLYSFSVFACGCSPLPFNGLSMKEFNTYDAVMKAIVLEIDGPESVEKATEYDYHNSYKYNPPPSKPSVLKLKVTKNIKGHTAQKARLVVMPSSKTDYYCSYNKLEVGKTYYFFTNKKNGEWTSTYTSRVIAPKSKLPAVKSLSAINKKMASLSTNDQKYKNLKNHKPFIERQVVTQQKILEHNLAFLNRILTNTNDIWLGYSEKKEAKGKLVNGLPVGYWEYYNANGTTIEKGTHKKYKRHGLWISYSRAGEVQKKANYINGKKEGEEVYFHDNGEIRLVNQFIDGKKEGVQKHYYQNGKLFSSTPFSNDKFHGICTRYSSSGQLKSSSPYKNGVPNGQFITFYNGKEASICTYKDGNLIGESFAYYPDGTLKQKSQYNNKGKLVGELISYNPDGSVKSKKIYDIDGKLRELFP